MRKLTIADVEMPATNGAKTPLSPKHERFAQELANGKSAFEAHAAAGYKPNRGNASVLKQDQNILARVGEILAEREHIHGQVTAQAIEEQGLTKAWIIERLMENAARAMQTEAVKDDDGNPIGEYHYQGNVANRALELLGKELGMFIDRKEVGKPGEFENMNADELREALRGEAEALGLGDVQAALAGRGRKSGEQLQ